MCTMDGVKIPVNLGCFAIPVYGVLCASLSPLSLSLPLLVVSARRLWSPLLSVIFCSSDGHRCTASRHKLSSTPVASAILHGMPLDANLALIKHAA